MAQEIERKFLVCADFKQYAYKSERVVQGYISSHADRSVRVRIKGDKAFLTIKGKSTADGLSRFEWEKEISIAEAEDLFKLCEPGVIDKIRYLITFDNKTFEVDEFFGDNEGLIIAELELESEAETFSKPEWIGEEVTGEARYYNAMLVKHPYKEWNDRS